MRSRPASTVAAQSPASGGSERLDELAAQLGKIFDQLEAQHHAEVKQLVEIADKLRSQAVKTTAAAWAAQSIGSALVALGTGPDFTRRRELLNRNRGLGTFSLDTESIAWYQELTEGARILEREAGYPDWHPLAQEAAAIKERLDLSAREASLAERVETLKRQQQVAADLVSIDDTGDLRARERKSRIDSQFSEASDELEAVRRAQRDSKELA